MPIHKRLTALGLVCVSAIVATSLIAQQRDVRDLTGFHSVSVGSGLDLFLRRGDTFSVEVESDEDPSKIITEVRDGTLEVRREREGSFFFGHGDEGEVYVTMPTLRSLSASGGSDVRTEGTFTADALRVSASGGSDVMLNATANRAEVEASGGSDIELTGSARTAHLQSSGGADLDAEDFVVDEADVESSGGSDLSIGVRNSITGHASGGSDVTYSGNPATVDVESSGGGDVSRR